MPTTPEIRNDPRLHLSVEILRHDPLQLRASGTSMLPALWPGDLLTIAPAHHQEIAPGDIVLVLRNNRFFIHRVIEKREGNACCLWITRGDAMPQSDPPATASDLLGRVVRICRGNRTFAPSRSVSMLHSALAYMFFCSSRIRSLALRIHAARLRAASVQPAHFIQHAPGAVQGCPAASGTRV